MSEMVERVGLAIARKVLEAKHNDLTWEDAGRAAIEAMREPTEGMVQVLTNFDIERGCYSDHNCTHNLWDHEAPILWQAAIDEALK